MSAVQRKDYGETAKVSPIDETVKRIHHINTPFSVEQLGLERSPENYIPVTDANLDTLVSAANTLAFNVQVILGNRKGYIKSVTTTGVGPFVLATAVLADKQNGEEVILGTYTKAELLANPELFLARVTP